MSEQWAAMKEALDEQLEAIRDQLPPELLERDVPCLCNDCGIKFTEKFSPFTLYCCPDCEGFNTTPIQVDAPPSE